MLSWPGLVSMGTVRMKLVAQLGMLTALALAVTGCQTTQTGEAPIDQVSVRYDPYDYSMARIRENAAAECRAKGGNRVVESTNTPNLESPRWAYMTFDCFR